MTIQYSFNQSHPRMIRLRREPNRFCFFQALRDIESVADDFPRLGHALSPTREAVRVTQLPNLEFAPNTIDSSHKSTSGRMHISQRFFGMFGPSGALPLHYTELVRNRTRHAHDPTIQAFLNLFHHRMALLFYRAWSSSRPAIQRDRPWQDRYSTYAGALAGFGLRNARNRDRFADETKWFYTGRFASIRRNAEGLEAVVGGCVQSPVVLKPFQLRHLPVETSDRTHLGRQSHALGRQAVLGRSVPDRQSCFELRVGPLSYHKFECLLPGSPRRKGLESLVRNYVGLGATARLRLVLAHQEVPKPQLGRLGQLGRNAWIHAKTPTSDLESYCQPLTADS